MALLSRLEISTLYSALCGVGVGPSQNFPFKTELSQRSLCLVLIRGGTSRQISVSSRAEPEGLRAGPSRAFYELFLCYTNEPTSRAFFEPSQEFHIVTSQIVNLRAKRSPSRARAELFGIFSYRCNEPSRAEPSLARSHP